MKFRKGQVIVYLVMVMVAITVLAVLNVDLFLSVRNKFRVQNSSDAAALQFARGQGELLNKLGDANLEIIETLIELVKAQKELEEAQAELDSAQATDNENKIAEANTKVAMAQMRVDEINKRLVEINLNQRRLALLGPLDGLPSASSIAARNGIEANDIYGKIMRIQALVVRILYDSGSKDAYDPYPQSYEGAWKEYADKIESVARSGLCVGVDNAEFYDLTSGNHLLYNIGFYQAILSKDWCWFYFSCYDFLKSYGSYKDFPPLERSEAVGKCENCEYGNLHVKFEENCLGNMMEPESIKEFLRDRSIDYPLDDDLFEKMLSIYVEWACYDKNYWRKWEEMYLLPVDGTPKEEFDYFGTTIVMRTSKLGTVSNAAAKTFARLDLETANMILPDFTDVRLIPVGAANATGSALNVLTNASDLEWLEHVRLHLLNFSSLGPDSLVQSDKCKYCKALRTWDTQYFRTTAITWLKFNHDKCKPPGQNIPWAGSCQSGGTPYGH